MSEVTFIYVAVFGFLSLAGSYCVFRMAEAEKYRRRVAELYRLRANGKSETAEASPVMNTDELARRVTEYQRDEFPCPTGRRPMTIKRPGRKRNVRVIEIDRRDEYLAKLGMYDEQCNNFIHLIKADLQLNGMS